MQPSSIKRPTAQKPAPGKTAKSKLAVPPVERSEVTPEILEPESAQDTASKKKTIQDFLGDDDDYDFGLPKAQRGGRKNRKKRKNKEVEVGEPDWDEIYDPTRPNDYNLYLGSTEQLRAESDFTNLLHYRHDVARGIRPVSSDDEDRAPPRALKKQFAPPSSYNFAPPAEFTTPSDTAATSTPAEVPSDNTGEDAFARRMRMSGMAEAPPEMGQDEPVPTPPSAEAQPTPPDTATTASRAPAPYDYRAGAGSIARAPVRYSFPSAPADMPSTEAELQSLVDESAAAASSAEEPQQQGEQPRSNRPGQAGFAERMLSKWGWSKGKGLGAKETGIITPLSVQAEKRKKRPDAEGGGWATPGGKGKIVGGKKAQKAEGEEGDDAAASPFGAMSNVVELKGMVEGLDLAREMAEGQLVGEIGDECAEKYGRVERVLIHASSTAEQVPVFVKFTSQLSALRAVNALQGRVFNGNVISARFFEGERFEGGMLD
ncbi:uncharacterized protein K452DRAFT_16947 [Aplosporella prunicola CBS 121167]|uniref:G-patch domain-containing protein n=1 Tax=Aplosporella prunicola CBS 121167 TaxID=1176127 RepID=A0A6A6BIB6_9PEZI|nr:uncharacterized protein K452DRAFT_16947 [Aplosporella prunicola CBS 121167]KAF2142301.1 hypothetical protein K452DRAFT_16947 [Aplosporella prunicola CBS 121167]